MREVDELRRHAKALQLALDGLVAAAEALASALDRAPQTERPAHRELRHLERKLLSGAETAALLGVKPQTLREWRSTKRYALPYIKVGRSVRYRREDVERFIEGRRNLPQQ